MKPIGNIMSLNASLVTVLGDAAVMAAWRGIDSNDCKDALSAAATGAGAVVVGDQHAFAVNLEMGQGIHQLFPLTEAHLVLIEALCNMETPEFLAWATSSPHASGRQIGTLEVPSGVLVAVDCADSCEEHADVLTELVKGVGNHDLRHHALKGEAGPHAGAALQVPPGSYRVVLESEQRTPGAAGRRCHLILE